MIDAGATPAEVFAEMRPRDAGDVRPEDRKRRPHMSQP